MHSYFSFYLSFVNLEYFVLVWEGFLLNKSLEKQWDLQVYFSGRACLHGISDVWSCIMKVFVGKELAHVLPCM